MTQGAARKRRTAELERAYAQIEHLNQRLAEALGEAPLVEGDQTLAGRLKAAEESLQFYRSGRVSLDTVKLMVAYRVHDGVSEDRWLPEELEAALTYIASIGAAQAVWPLVRDCICAACWRHLGSVPATANLAQVSAVLRRGVTRGRDCPLCDQGADVQRLLERIAGGDSLESLTADQFKAKAADHARLLAREAHDRLRQQEYAAMEVAAAEGYGVAAMAA